MLWSFAYLVVRRLFQLIVICCRSSGSKELEILVLRHELKFWPPEPDERRDRSLVGEIRRRERFGGPIHENYRAAA